MMEQKYFDIITNKVYDKLKGRNFEQSKVESGASEQAAMFTSDTAAYMVVYYEKDKRVKLMTCAVADGVPDNNWNTVSTWLFDPNTDGTKEAESIGTDFTDCLSVNKLKKSGQKKKKNSDDGNADPLFFCKRLVNVFPELKEEIYDEEDCYNVFRGATFVRKSVVPKINMLLLNGDKGIIRKLASILNTQYNNGDIDTRSIITMVILNSIDQNGETRIAEFLSDDLKKSWQFAKHYKGKKVKPEKAKKKTVLERLSQQ